MKRFLLLFLFLFIFLFNRLFCQDITQYTAYSGTFDDGSGPLPYDGATEKLYVISPAGATRVQMRFTQFDVDADADYIFVYDGASPDAPLIDVYNMLHLPPSVFTSTGKSMCIKFVTDVSGPWQGWTVSYTGITDVILPVNSTVDYDYDDHGNRILRTIEVQGDSNNNTKTQQIQKVQEEDFGEKKLLIYPNPTYGKLSLEMIGYEKEEHKSLYLFNMSGTLILNKESLQSKEIIDLTSYPVGTYILKLKLGNDASEWKIVKK